MGRHKHKYWRAITPQLWTVHTHLVYLSRKKRLLVSPCLEMIINYSIWWCWKCRTTEKGTNGITIFSLTKLNCHWLTSEKLLEVSQHFQVEEICQICLRRQSGVGANATLIHFIALLVRVKNNIEFTNVLCSCIILLLMWPCEWWHWSEYHSWHVRKLTGKSVKISRALAAVSAPKKAAVCFEQNMSV